jgi:lysophospholipase L1-like esterase
MRKFLGNLGLLALSLLLTAALLEGVLRTLGRDLLPSPDLYREDPDTGKRLRPGWEGDEFGAPVRINSKGLRNPEVEYAKPPGVYRILALGDSWTFGFRLAEPDCYPRQLERALAERARLRGDPRRFEVINAGVIGYSTDQEAAYLRVEGYRYEPDLVVVAYYPVNDTHNKLYKYERYARLREIHPLLLELYTFPRHLYLREFISGARRMLKLRLGQARVRVASRLGVEDHGGVALAENDWTTPYRDGARGWEATKTALAEIGDLGRQYRHETLVALLPDALDLARYSDRYHPRVAPLVRDAVAGAGLAFYDLEPVFRPWRERNDEIRMAGQRHPNAFGYSLIAEAIAAEIERRYLLAPDPSPQGDAATTP